MQQYSFDTIFLAVHFNCTQTMLLCSRDLFKRWKACLVAGLKLCRNYSCRAYAQRPSIHDQLQGSQNISADALSPCTVAHDSCSATFVPLQASREESRSAQQQDPTITEHHQLLSESKTGSGLSTSKQSEIY